MSAPKTIWVPVNPRGVGQCVDIGEEKPTRMLFADSTWTRYVLAEDATPPAPRKVTCIYCGRSRSEKFMTKRGDDDSWECPVYVACAAPKRRKRGAKR